MGVSHNVNINIVAKGNTVTLHIPEYWIIHKRGDIGCFTKHIELLPRQPMTPKNAVKEGNLQGFQPRSV